MKNRIGVIVLVLLCLGLLIGLVTVKKQSGDQHSKDVETIQDYSNHLVTTSKSLDDQKQVAALLEKDLDTQKTTLTQLTNDYTKISANLAETSANLAKTQTALQDSQQELAKRDTRISELETQNQALDKKAVDLSSAITNLNLQIADTQHKLSASEGDKAFLEKELKRLMTEKTELERQFNDLKVLRAQVAKLKEEMNIARRLDWIRQGIFANNDQKGAQKLMLGAAAPQRQVQAPKPTYDLNVEVSSDGSVKVIPPLSPGATNSPAAK